MAHVLRSGSLAVFRVSSLTSSGGLSHAVLLGLPLLRVGGFLGIPPGISGFLLPRLAANRLTTATPTKRPALKSWLSGSLVWSTVYLASGYLFAYYVYLGTTARLGYVYLGYSCYCL